MSDPQPRRFAPGGVVALAAALAASAVVQGQSNWVDWTDATASRLQLSVVGVGDTQEKDVTAADLDNDGDTDIIVVRKLPFSNPGGDVNVLLLNDGGILVDHTAELIPAFLTPDDSRDVLAFDSNGDGWLDIVTANTFTEQPRLFVNQGSDAGGTFLGFVEDTAWFTPLFSPAPMFCAVSAGDVSGDGAADLFFSDYNNPLEDRLLINDGSGHFVDETDLRLAPGMKTSAFGTGNIIADFNGDGWNDILKLTTLFAPSALRLLINDGSGSFSLMQDLSYNAVYMIDALDFDGDGRLDVYVESDNQDYQLLNTSTNPDGTINTTKVMIANSGKTAGFGGNVHHADLNRDGFLDVGVADVDVDIPGCTRRFGALANRGSGGAGSLLSDPNNPTNLPWNSTGNHDFAFLDLDGDGFTDLFQARCTGFNVFLMDPFAVAETHGVGCPGSNGVPKIGAVGAPALGNAGFGLTLSQGASNTVPLLVLSTGGGPLPTPSGCTLLVDIPLLGVLAGPSTDATGSTAMNLPIPNDLLLEGLHLFGQWVTPDAAGPLGTGFTVSDGVELYVSANVLP